MKLLYAIIMADIAIMFITFSSGLYLFGSTFEQSFGMALMSACALTTMVVIMEFLRSC